MATSGEIRTWLVNEGYKVGAYGRVSGELVDIYNATTEGYLPKGYVAVSYVNEVRRWMLANGNAIERLSPIPLNRFAQFNEVFKLEDTTEEVLKGMEEPLSTWTDQEIDDYVSVENAKDRRIAEELTKPLSLAELKAMEAAEHEAHEVNRRMHSGTAKVTHAMNQSFVNLVSTALLESIRIINEAFNPDGTSTDDTYPALTESMGCMKQAAVLVDNMLHSFSPIVEIPNHLVVGPTLVGRRFHEAQVRHSEGMILDYDDGDESYLVEFDRGPRLGTQHYLKREEFHLL